jgi:hypothetical protein
MGIEWEVDMSPLNPMVGDRSPGHMEPGESNSAVLSYASTIVMLSVTMGIVALVVVLWLVS